MPDYNESGSTDALDEGSSLLHEQESERSMTHQVRLISGHNKWEWCFLLLSILNVVLIITSACVSLHLCKLSPMLQQPFFAVETLTCLVAGISMLFSVHGVIAEHRYDIQLHILFSLTAICLNSTGSTFLDGCSIGQRLLGICNPISVILWSLAITEGRKATNAADWIEFRIIGVSNALADMYRQLCLILAVLKFDAIFMVIASLFTAKHIFKFDMDTWIVYQVVIIVYALVLWSIGKIAVLREDFCLVIGYYMLNTYFAGFTVYQLTEAVKSDEENIAMFISQIAFCVAVILCKIYSLCCFQKTLKTFGHDLNSQSFRDLVMRNSNSLLARSRSNLVF